MCRKCNISRNKSNLYIQYKLLALQRSQFLDSYLQCPPEGFVVRIFVVVEASYLDEEISTS